MQFLFLASLFSGATVQADVVSRYRIVARPTSRLGAPPRGLQSSASDIDGSSLSFDGNVSAIQQLALEKSMTNVLAPTASPTTITTSEPTPATSAFVPFTCPEDSIETLQLLTWDYAVEILPDTDLAPLLNEVEWALQVALAPRLLACQNEDLADVAIVALDAEPMDTAHPTAICEPLDDENDCVVYQGRMRLFLGNETQDEAMREGRLATENIISSISFAASIGLGLVRTEYLGPVLTEPTPIVPPIAEDDDIDGNRTLGNASIAVIAAASAALVVLVGSVYFWRPGGEEHSADGAATQAAGSSMHETGMAEDSTSSPFSKMLPNSYQFTEEMSILSVHSLDNRIGLSAVPEIPSGDEMSCGSQSIVMSDSGYTAEANDSMSFDLPKSLYMRPADSPMLLGAKKRMGSATTANQSDIFSEISSSDESSTSSASAIPDQDLLADTMLLNSSIDSKCAGNAVPANVLDQSALSEDEDLLFL
ncbi:predicted protein [Phaeodactylum tricornutum CCAP 1055/1]|uniref:Uncharacterized protein n=1 Tax=Phaeodactylum tricornutum (strain CCAP 1055/1) TaxID=556484 RepID=B7G389_PHATC|nr:predicted protein [Phaeodactylum tricornutum CCAP 1055/1]EEC46789.1 predicted protein [Phaeodactylum tricornutum CCAP 1055/1]|eukprot:XP_002181575.1 predicted protein [Phaeodactylum tricornutum CCAP 1055/1]